MVRHRHKVCYCSLLLLSLLLVPRLVSASLPHNSYLHLVNRHRRLHGSADGQPASPCAGKQAGDPIEGQYIVVFDTKKVPTVEDGITAVRKGLQTQAVTPAAAAAATATAAGAAFPQDASAPTSPADPFTVVKVVSTGPAPSSSSSSSSTQGRRLLGRRPRRRPVFLGAVVTVPVDAAGEVLVQSIGSVGAVKTVMQDLCVKALDSQERFKCLPATMLSSSIQQPIATAAWADCLTSNTYLAWYGERCGSKFDRVLWTGVYAFDKTTGARLPNCLKQRPASGTPSADLVYWLGGCGLTPAAVPTLPNRVCQDPYISDTLVAAEDQGCMAFNFTAATQTLDLFHPVSSCGTGAPVSMTYRGQRCSSNNGNSSSAAAGGILWQTAEPAPGSGLDAATCTLQRRTGTAAEDLIFNMDWFGSCGVPPARVQYIPRLECPAPPPVPPPSPSPTPEDQKALEREPMVLGETAPSGMMRILAVTPNTTSSSGLDTVKMFQPTTVVVMDSGVDCFHRDLNVVFNKSFVKPAMPSDPLGDAKGCWDVYDHGTNVAGVIGAKNNGYGVVGILPGVPIVSLKMLGSDGTGPVSNILDAAAWLLKNSIDGANPNADNQTNAEVLGVDVINMSFGYSSTSTSPQAVTVCDIFAALRADGVAAAAAAGNEQQPLNGMYPAACEGVIAVTALRQGNGTVDVTQEPAKWFSNFLDLSPNAAQPMTFNKPNFTVCAPGENVYSTCYQQANAFCERTGTSQATPHVSGMLARCYSGGRCKTRGNGTLSADYATRKWTDYNLANVDYGYAADPIRSNRSIYYWGYLTCADVW